MVSYHVETTSQNIMNKELYHTEQQEKKYLTYS